MSKLSSKSKARLNFPFNTKVDQQAILPKRCPTVFIECVWSSVHVEPPGDSGILGLLSNHNRFPLSVLWPADIFFWSEHSVSPLALSRVLFLSNDPVCWKGKRLNPQSVCSLRRWRSAVLSSLMIDILILKGRRVPSAQSHTAPRESVTSNYQQWKLIQIWHLSVCSTSQLSLCRLHFISHNI